MTLHVLHVLHGLDPHSGGPFAALRDVVDYQWAAGLRVTVLGTDAQFGERALPAGELRAALAADSAFAGARVELIEAAGRAGPLRHFGWAPAAKERLQQLLSATDKPSIVHVHGLFSHIGMLAAAAARRAAIPYIVRPAGILNPACFSTGNTLLKRALYLGRVRGDLRGAAALHATSPREAAYLASLLPGARVFEQPHGVRLPSPADLAAAAERFRDEHPGWRGRRLVLFLSRLAPKKRLDLLLRAFAACDPVGRDLQLLVAGSDHGAEAATRNLAEELGLGDRFALLGFLQGDAKAAALAAADLFALTSIDENFGIVVTEALAHATPVLVTEGVDSHAYVDEAGAGRTVACELDAIAVGLRELLDEDLPALGERGRAHAEATLGWPAVVENLSREYERCLFRA